MYWYLSFLRPPPTYITLPSEGVVITPQVANDLRTELREAATEILYTWQRLEPPAARATKPAVLTTFEPPESTYKPIVVKLPKTARAGERWRLGLCTTPAGPEGQTLLSLSEDDVGILGVWSEGIELRAAPMPTGGPIRGIGEKGPRGRAVGQKEEKGKNGKGKGKEKQVGEGAKQTRIHRSWGLPDGRALKVVEQTSFDLDKKVWDSGLALCSWLWRWTESVQPHSNVVAAGILERLKAGPVLELGAGTGLVSIALALLDGKRQDLAATDLESALEIMRENVDLNELSGVRADVLDWDASLPSWVSEAWPRTVVAADVTYNTASFPALVATVERLLSPPKGESPPLLLAYKQRDPAERELWNMLRDKGIGSIMVDRIQGAEAEGATEIWVFGKDIA